MQEELMNRDLFCVMLIKMRGDSFLNFAVGEATFKALTQHQRRRQQKQEDQQRHFKD